MDIRRNKPLWGFGPIGWIALAILTTLVVALLRGWDVVHAATAITWHLCDGDWDRWVRLWHKWTWLPHSMWYGLTFGVWGLLYTTIALFIYPHKLSRIAVVLLFVTVLVEGYTFKTLPPAWSANLGISDYVLLGCGAAVIEAILLFWITRRWWCAAMLIVPLIWKPLFERHLTAVDPGLPATLAFHTLVAAPLLTWAIAARLKPAPPGKPCPSCDYDLTGLADSATCPECGRAQTPAAS